MQLSHLLVKIQIKTGATSNLKVEKKRKCGAY